MSNTKQPEWELLGNFGDVNPIERGGYFVFRDSTGVYDPEAELLESPDNDDGAWYVYRFVLEPHTFIDGVLSDNPYHPAFPAWYADKLESVADCVGVDVDDLRGMLLSSDPAERAEGYRCLIAYFGPDEFDHYPLTMGRAEVDERYGSPKYRTD